MAIIPICKAAAISWALIFSGSFHHPVFPVCFSEQLTCEISESAANLAFAYDDTSTTHKAHCVQQPAGFH